MLLAKQAIEFSFLVVRKLLERFNYLDVCVVLFEKELDVFCRFTLLRSPLGIEFDVTDWSLVISQISQDFEVFRIQDLGPDVII